MRVRVSREDVEYYSRARRQNQPVRYQGSNWRVQGVTIDTPLSNVSTTGLDDHISGHSATWWVELIEA
jgi:hypothetical protein